MIAIYPYVEFLHVAAVVLWLGGGSMCIFSAMKADRADSAADFTRVLADTVFFANWLFVPAALVAFAAGLTMAYLGELLSELWIWIGVSGFAITFLTGLLVIKPRAEKLLAAIKSGPSAEVFGPGREIVRIAKFDYVVLFTVARTWCSSPGLRIPCCSRSWRQSSSRPARCSWRRYFARRRSRPKVNATRLIACAAANFLDHAGNSLPRTFVSFRAACGVPGRRFR